MDNVTHALAGGVLGAIAAGYVERRAGREVALSRFPPLWRAATLVGVIAAELPDADVFYAGPLMGMGKLGNLLHHRGHTHTVLFAIAGALLVWGAALAIRRELRAPPARNALLALALAGTLSHIALDYTNSYGVHPFWPFDSRWFYGDAIFIIEPWLWIVAIPALFLVTTRVLWRALLGAALAAILVAAWSVDMVETETAIAFSVGAVSWFALLAMLTQRRRVIDAAAAWVAVEATFFASVIAARSEIRSAIGTTYRDAALTPLVGNPLCVRGLVVSLEGDTYRVREAMIAPVPSVRDVRACGLLEGGSLVGGATVVALPATGPDTGNESSGVISWGKEWSAPRAELATLAASNCEVAAALQFMRVPAWTRQADGTVELFDLRYARGGSGWASISASVRPAKCPAPLPGWTPPRSDVLAGG